MVIVKRQGSSKALGHLVVGEELVDRAVVVARAEEVGSRRVVAADIALHQVLGDLALRVDRVEW